MAQTQFDEISLPNGNYTAQEAQCLTCDHEFDVVHGESHCEVCFDKVCGDCGKANLTHPGHMHGESCDACVDDAEVDRTVADIIAMLPSNKEEA